MRVEVQIAGFGGQGIVLAGVVLAEAALRDGRHAVQSQSYGPESRGGAARSDVVMADGPVDHPKVLTPMVIVTMSQPAFDKYVGAVPATSQPAPGAPRGLTIIDADLVKTDDQQHCRAPFTKIADDLGKKIVANMVMLGYLTAASAVVTRGSMLDAIESRVPAGTFDLNRQAFELGFRLGKDVPGGPLSPWA